VGHEWPVDSGIDRTEFPSVSERNAYRRKAVQKPEAADGERAAARIAERLIENPAMSGGLVVMALTAAAIISNAMLMQNARHPEPLFSTRPSAESKARTPIEVPLPRARIDKTAAEIVTPAPRPATLPQPATRDEIAALQRELTGKGFYDGPVDGISGTRTRAAISAYQQAAGLDVTGEPTATILDYIRTASVRTAPLPPTRPVAETAKNAPAPVIPAKISRPEAPETEPLPVATKRDVAASPEAAPAPAAPAADSAALERAIEATDAPALPEPVPAVAAAPATPDPEAIARDRTRAVQHALNEIGYGPVSEDGVATKETTDAIRRFELDNGLPLTGDIGDRLIRRLVAIGAMEAT
jgi:peptidoglycan hydrolase-like protein with peptidoglycan-binding domain